ncbi:pectinesterase QRT1-like [Henckelia pumila]|uniref:pectinesterase QRT1-like n=1 Tax=Henckelia pumila TaxID=405737 RepID=UPI003C6EA2FD
MNFAGFSVWFFSLLVLWDEIQVGFSQNDGGRKDYITWDDLIIEEYSFDFREYVGKQQKVLLVDKNGRGDSLTVQGAVDMVPENNAERVKIHILPGIYREKVKIPASKPYISLIGKQDQVSETIITWNDKASDRDKNGFFLGTWNSASVTVLSDYFCASGITFENSVVSPGGGVDGYQAVALRISGDKAMFYKVRFLGIQDTLLDQTGTHYFYQCFILGSTDFIFGNAKSLYQDCRINAIGDDFAIAAHHRKFLNEDTGFSFLNCTVDGTGSVYLGRAWGIYSRIIYSYCKFNIDIRPGGWENWGIPSRQKTVLFGEYQCGGRGADRRGRVPWSKALGYLEAKSFLDTTFIKGEQWLRL